jgi:hypothetical protein
VHLLNPSFAKKKGAKWYMKKKRKIKNENGAKKQQKTTFLMQMIYCDRRVKVVFLLDVNDYKTKIREYYKYRS